LLREEKKGVCPGGGPNSSHQKIMGIKRKSQPLEVAEKKLSVKGFSRGWADTRLPPGWEKKKRFTEGVGGGC